MDPFLQSWLERVEARLERVEEKLDGRIRALEVESGKVSIKLGLWGGACGIIAGAITLLSALL